MSVGPSTEISLSILWELVLQISTSRFVLLSARLSPSGLKAKKTAFGSCGNCQVEATERVCSFAEPTAMPPRAKSPIGIAFKQA